MLWTLVIGYPVRNIRETQSKVYSRRCFQIGNWNNYVQCLKTGEKLQGKTLVDTIQKNVSSLYPGFGLLLFFAILMHVVIVLFILILH